jgi:hypothetical protein
LKRYLEFTYKCKLQGIKQRLKVEAKPEAEAQTDALTIPTTQKRNRNRKGMRRIRQIKERKANSKLNSNPIKKQRSPHMYRRSIFHWPRPETECTF